MGEMMRVNSFSNSNQVKEEIDRLKSLMTDHFSIQNELNKKISDHMETVKQAKLSKMITALSTLYEKYENLDDEVEDITEFFQNLDFHCDCGKSIKIIFPNADHDSHDDGDGTSTDNQQWKDLWSKHIASNFSINENIDYRYSDMQKSVMGKSLNGWEQCGPVEALNYQGLWQFRLADYEDDEWNHIVTKQIRFMDKTGEMYGRYLMLPPELSGLTIIVKLNGISSGQVEGFQISILAPDIDAIEQNRYIKLPVSLCVNMEMKLLNGESKSFQHYFIIQKLFKEAQDDNWIIPFENTRTDKLPEMTFQFSKRSIS